MGGSLELAKSKAPEGHAELTSTPSYTTNQPPPLSLLSLSAWYTGVCYSTRIEKELSLTDGRRLLLPFQRSSPPPSSIISPSVLASDFGNLTGECTRMIKEGADWLHMGKFILLIQVWKKRAENETSARREEEKERILSSSSPSSSFFLSSSTS